MLLGWTCAVIAGAADSFMYVGLLNDYIVSNNGLGDCGFIA
jgi:hypothetical protein